VYSAFNNGSTTDVLWFVIFNFTVAMFLMNFVIAHVLNTFALISNHIVEASSDSRTVLLERPLASNAKSDSPVDHLPIIMHKTPSLMRLWQMSLPITEVRRRMQSAASRSDILIDKTVLESLHLSFKGFLLRRRDDLHRRNMAIRVCNMPMSVAVVAGALAAASGAGVGGVSGPIPGAGSFLPAAVPIRMPGVLPTDDADA
jgi:hypothetical protein